MGRSIGRAFGGAMLSALAAGPAAAGERVSIELVLAVDTSASVNGAEYVLQMQGIAEAFRDEEVIATIAAQDGVAVALIQWAGWVGPGVLGWRVLRDRGTVLAFAAEVEAAPRQENGVVTAIGSAIAEATEMIRTNGHDGRLLKIDVSGDGQNNAGFPIETARRHAEQLGITVNGLAILTDTADLDRYFRDVVIAGDGAFVISTADYVGIAEAMRIKLLRELTPPTVAGIDPRAQAASRAPSAGSSRSTSASQ